MIPVIGIPIVNGVDLLENLIQSIDYPVNEVFIVNNNGRNQINESLDIICKKSYKYINRVRVSHLPSNIGCAASWNLIIKCYLMCPYWIICNHDITFPNGLLMEIYEKMIDPNNKFLQSAEKNWELFTIKDNVIQECGLFDENYYPAYCEDVDYYYKLLNKKIDINYTEKKHEKFNKMGSHTWRTELTLEKRLFYSNESNQYYICDKWGYNPNVDDSPWLISQPYKFPFNNPNISISNNSYDLNFVRRKYLGF
jgi:GT2 family glycosyltransferase